MIRRILLLSVLALVCASARAATLVSSNTATGSGSTLHNSMSVSLTSVASGDLILLTDGWDCSGSGGTTIGATDGTSSLTELSNQSAYNSGKGEEDAFSTFYLLSANAGATVTYTVNYGATCVSSDELTVWEFHGGGTWSLDAHSENYDEAGSTAVDTGSITTTGTDEAVVFSGKLYHVAATTSGAAIDSLSISQPTWSPTETFDHYYYALPTSTFTGSGTKSYSTATTWFAALDAFSSATSSSGSPPNYSVSPVGTY